MLIRTATCTHRHTHSWSTKKFGMTSPKSRIYGVPEFAGTEVNRRSGKLKGLMGTCGHFTNHVAGISGRQHPHTRHDGRNTNNHDTHPAIHTPPAPQNMHMHVHH